MPSQTPRECPFCGSTDIHAYASRSKTFRDYKGKARVPVAVSCNGCFSYWCPTAPLFDARNEPLEQYAIAAWNRRAGKGETK